ncbi:unnamed protein product [Durusdinium trenchii]|uniref:RRM domain-containing protein n=1 Tax=Durusdinium trenchii TaxID=1381693 RepID=A0ABP0PY04_9DINO
MTKTFQDFPGAGYLRLRGLPFSAGPAEVTEFFAEFGVLEDNVILGTTVDGRSSGEAWVQFVDTSSAEEAKRQKDRQLIGGRYIEIFGSSHEDSSKQSRGGFGGFGGGGFGGKGMGKSMGPPSGGLSLAQSALSAMGMTPMAKDTESYAYAAGGGSAYLRLRGLPFSASTSDVATFFAEYGVSEDQVILGSEGRRLVNHTSAMTTELRILVFSARKKDQDPTFRGGGKGGGKDDWSWYMANMATMGWYAAMAQQGKGGDRYQPY